MHIIRRLVSRYYVYVPILLVGIALKFYHLDYKLLWIDEVYTIQHTSGIPDKEYPTMAPVNEIKNAGFYRDLYRLKKQDHAIWSQLKGLLASPQLNPLHYPLLMVWYRAVGDNPVHFRLFSVCIFVITLPFLFLLSKRLFDSSLAGWIAISLYAISPYVHLFAQEARYYILWSFILIVLHYSLLQVIHRNDRRWWSTYTILATLSLYSSPVSILIIVGHVVFVGITRKDLLQRYGISLLVVFLAYLPWGLSLSFRLDAIASALSWQSTNPHNVAFWLPLVGQCLYVISIVSFKVDYLTAFDQASLNITPDIFIALAFNTIVFIMMSVSIVFLLMRTKKDVKYFLLLIMIPGFMAFYINDLLRNGMTSWWWRYLIFLAPGVILALTNLLYRKIEKGSLLCSICYVVLAFIGTSSIGTIAKARHWHIGKTMDVYLATARLISQAEKPLLITDLASSRSMVDLTVVMQECSSDSIHILRASPGIESFEKQIKHRGFSDIYVVYSSDELVSNLKSQCDGKMEKVDFGGISSMWKIALQEKYDVKK